MARRDSPDGGAGAGAVDEEIGALYAADPAGFVARRDALAGRLRAAGDRDGADRVRRLRRPTRSAWALDVLAREDPDAVAALIELGGQLRAAQDRLDGAALRRLGPERRRTVDDLARRAVRLGGLDDASGAVRDEIRATLDAALADPDTAAALRAGTLDRAREPGGFSDDGTTSAFAASAAMAADARRSVTPSRTSRSAPARTPRKPDDAADREARRHGAAERRAELREARSTLHRAEAELGRATDEERARAVAVERAEAELARRRDQLDDARARLETAREVHEQAEQSLRAAEQR